MCVESMCNKSETFFYWYMYFLMGGGVVIWECSVCIYGWLGRGFYGGCNNDVYIYLHQWIYYNKLQWKGGPACDKPSSRVSTYFALLLSLPARLSLKYIIIRSSFRESAFYMARVFACCYFNMLTKTISQHLTPLFFGIFALENLEFIQCNCFT